MTTANRAPRISAPLRALQVTHRLGPRAGRGTMHTRRATPDDGPAISALITNCGGTPKYRKRFGTFNVANLLESGYLALVVGDRDLASSEGHQMLGFLVFSDGPRGAPHAAEPWLAALSAARFAPGKGPTIGDAVSRPSGACWTRASTASRSN